MTAFFTVEDELRLARELAFAIGQTKNEREALGIALALICRATSWCLGQAWTPRGNSLACSDTWYCDSQLVGAVSEFRAHSLSLSLERDIGLPGRVWQSGAAIWAADICSDANFPRRDAAVIAGLHAGFAIPVAADGEVVAVLEFFVLEARSADATLLEAISAVAAPLGALILHKSAEQALRESEAELQALVRAIDDLVIVMDNEGRYLRVAPGNNDLLYRPAHELIGKTVHEVLPREDAERFQEVIALALETKCTKHIEYSLTIGGEILWFSANISPMNETQIVWVSRDITERKSAEVQLTQAEKNYRGIFENAIEGIFQTDKTGHYLSANPALAKIYGYESPTEMMGHLTDIAHQLYVDEGRRNDFAQLLANYNDVTKFESQVRRKDGTVIWISENARAVRNADNEILYYEGSVEDITERKLQEALLSDQQARLQEINLQLQALATLDGLTGLKNHRAMQEKFVLECERAMQEKRPLSVLLLDVDKFKDYNDSFGHPAGDAVLKQLAIVLKENARDTDFVARYGGEEFAVILTGASREGALASAERFRRSIEGAKWPKRAITASLGVATFDPTIASKSEVKIEAKTDEKSQVAKPEKRTKKQRCSDANALSPDAAPAMPGLFTDADRALYWSKASGRNRTTHSDDI